MRVSARNLGGFFALALVAITAGLALADGDGGVPLPIRKVMLYKNGIGYFEHLGEVRGAVPVDITFSSAQLNDVLKSLTVLDLAPALADVFGAQPALPVIDAAAARLVLVAIVISLIALIASEWLARRAGTRLHGG